MTSVSKNVHIDKLDNLINKNNNTYHRATKTKPINVKSSTYIYVNKYNKKKSPKFKVFHHVRISKYKNIFCKRLFQIGLKKILELKKLKKLCLDICYQ